MSGLFDNGKDIGFFGPLDPGPSGGDNSGFIHAIQQQAAIGYTWSLTPSSILEARFGFTHVLGGKTPPYLGGVDIAKQYGILGLPSSLAGGFPTQVITGFSSPTFGRQATNPQFQNPTSFNPKFNYSFVRGRHSVKTGYEFLAIRTEVLDINPLYGQDTYNNQYSKPTCALLGQAAGCAIPADATSYNLADFFFGLPSNIAQGSNLTTNLRQHVNSLYVQDDWRITPKLTLNLGLRWEYHTPWVEVKDRQVNFDEFTGQPLFAGQSGNSRGLYSPYKKDFQPRVGFAYTPEFTKDKLVIRGAYTISSYLEGTGTNLRLTLNPPYGVEYGALYNTSAYTLPPTTLDKGLSALVQKDPYAGATLRIWDPKVRPAESQQWNLSMDYELPRGNVLTVGYIGQHSTHLMVPMSYNQKILVNGVAQPGPFLAGNPAIKNAISVVSGTASIGNQKYDALQSTLRKRLKSGLEYQVAFTYSHGRSDAIGYYGQGGQAGSQSAYWQNLYNQKSEWGPTYFDNKFTLVPSFVYELPIGTGRKYGASMNKYMNGVVGGWQLGGIFTAHTGFPLTIKMSGDPSGTGARSFRANVIGTPNDPHQIGPGALWLDPTAYAQPTSGTFGNAGVGIVRGPGMNRMDLSLSKNFNITEHKYIQVRAEAFNFANTPIFLSPASQTITSSLFGQIRSSEGERNVQVVAKFYF